MKALLVGAGGMGRSWAKNLADCDDVILAGWVDIRPGAAEAVSQEMALAIPFHGDDLPKALVDVKPDFVVDVTVPEAHHDVTLTALAAGVPVLGEKPMAASMAQARAMVAASEHAGQLYMVSQSRRYDAGLWAMRRLISEGIGTPGILNADFYIGAHFGGFREEMASPLLLDMAIHTFDQARFLSQADPISVYCEEFNPPWSWYKGDAGATAFFEMTGGLRYTYCGSWCADGHPTSWQGSWRAVGPHGSARWEGAGTPTAEVVVEQNGFHASVETRTELPDPHFAEGISGSLRDFLHALRTGAVPMGECHDNIKSLAMVFAAIESSRMGRRVAVEIDPL